MLIHLGTLGLTSKDLVEFFDDAFEVLLLVHWILRVGLHGIED
jgi:hypothetical protein